MLIGGGGEKKTLRLVAKHADIWHSFGDLTTSSASARYSPGIARRSAAIPREIVKSVGTPRRGDPADTGPPLVEAGASLFTVGVGGPDYDLTR